MATITEIMKPGRTAVVTGASSGIGKAACLRFASAGMHVIGVDIDKKELQLAVEEIKEAAKDDESQKILSKVVDVGDIQAMQDLAEYVYTETQGCNILFNNAGIGLGGGALTDIKTVEKVMSVNAYGPIHGCLAFVGRMKASQEPGLIINTGSKQGITMPPGNLTYNMSKAALKCYTEGLEHELMLERMENKHHLRAALLVPGWTNTEILLKAEREKAAAKGQTYDDSKAFFSEMKPHSGAWMPSQVIDFMVHKLDGGSFYIICPDNDVDEETDKLRMTWTMQDITQNRPPLSRWHPDYKDQFTKFLEDNKP